jgi:hypothetical protein
MLFGDFLPSVDLNPERLALLDTVLSNFRTAFPNLHFELRLDRRVVNAQAILLDGERCVLIYGGIGLHPALGENSLTFVLLHEVGHHLAVGLRSPSNPSLACECVADSWAAGEGAEILHQKSGRQLDIQKALNELEYLMSDTQQPESQHPKKPNPICWNHNWPHRRSALEVSVPLSSNHFCELNGSQ